MKAMLYMGNCLLWFGPHYIAMCLHFYGTVIATKELRNLSGLKNLRMVSSNVKAVIIPL